MGTVLQGNEACVEGAISAGMRFFSGYPITPSTEIAESCAVRLPQVGGIFIEMEDEMASIAAAIGASVSGTKALKQMSCRQDGVHMGIILRSYYPLRP